MAINAGELLGEAVLSRAVAVADDLRAQPGRGVLGSRERAEYRGVAFDHEDLAVRAGRRDHRNVQSHFQVPAGQHTRRRERLGLALLVDLAETAAAHRAWRQPEMLPVNREVPGEV